MSTVCRFPPITRILSKCRQRIGRSIMGKNLVNVVFERQILPFICGGCLCYQIAAQMSSTCENRGFFAVCSIVLWSGTKGQLISECLFDVLNLPKNQRNIWQISALEYKKWSNHNDLDTNYVQFFKYYKKVSLFFDITTFYILGQKFVKCFVGFLENLRHHQDILRLTDLYPIVK